MAYGVFQPQRWRKQPSGVLEFDLKNPLTRGIDWVADTRNPNSSMYWNSQRKAAVFRILDNSGLEVSPPVPYSDPNGEGSKLSHDHHKFSDVGVVDSTNQTKPLTLFTLTRQTIGSGYGFTESRGVVGRGKDGDGGGWNAYVGWHHPSSTFRAYCVYTDGGAASYEADGATNCLNKTVPVIAVYEPFSGIKVFVSGKLDGSYSNATKGTFRNSTSGYNIGIAGDYGSWPVNGFGIFYLQAAWLRVLGEGEISALSENPWQLFRPRRPVVYSLAAVTPTLSAATVISISSTGATPRVTLTF